MQGKRTERVSSLLQMELSRLILERVKDPRLGFVTITHVKVTADLKSAVVFFTVMGDKKKKDDSLDVLKRAAGFLQKEVGHILTMRYTPRLQFELDDMIDKSFEIEEVIKKLDDHSPVSQDETRPCPPPACHPSGRDRQASSQDGSSQS